MIWQFIYWIFKLDNKILDNYDFCVETAVQLEYVVFVSLTLKRGRENHLSSCSLFDARRNRSAASATSCVVESLGTFKRSLGGKRLTTLSASAFVYIFQCSFFWLRMTSGNAHVTVATGPCCMPSPFSLDLFCCLIKVKYPIMPIHIWYLTFVSCVYTNVYIYCICNCSLLFSV